MVEKSNKLTLLAQNRKAFADYEILKKYETGIVLNGPEVKSARAGQINLKGSFVEITPRLEAFVRNIHISPYKMSTQNKQDPIRKRKLLLHKKEILAMKAHLDTRGHTIVPLDFHLNKNHIKVTIGVCRGKKQYDRRNDLKKKSQNLEINRALRRY
jgi:SsrA-binding protein